MYYGQSFSFLNDMIQGQESSLEMYINLADSYMKYTLSLIFILITTLWLIMSFPRIIINYKQENSWFVCDYSFIESISKNKIKFLNQIEKSDGMQERKQKCDNVKDEQARRSEPLKVRLVRRLIATCLR